MPLRSHSISQRRPRRGAPPWGGGHVRLPGGRGAIGAFGLTLGLLCGLLVTALPWLAGAGDTEVRVYPAKHRSAEELRPLAESVMSGAGRAAVDRRSNTLVLSGEPDALERALELLGSLDVARSTVALRYESTRRAVLEQEGIEVEWQLDTGRVRVGNVRRGGPGSQLALRIDDDVRRTQGRTRGQLRILDGETGRISMGSRIPVERRSIERGRYGGQVIRESVEYVNAESGFEATPRVRGDGRIELTLRPFAAELARDGTLEISEADTVVVIEPGETVAIGEVLRELEQRDRGPLSERRAAARDEVLLLITAELE